MRGWQLEELDARLEKQVQETTLHLIVCNDVQYKMLKSKNVKIQHTRTPTHTNTHTHRHSLAGNGKTLSTQLQVENVLQFSFCIGLALICLYVAFENNVLMFDICIKSQCGDTSCMQM